jgi:signal transduction histidine kinase
MLNSLRFRLLLAFALVVVIAIGTVALFASRSTTSEFRRSVQYILDYPNYSITSKIEVINKFLAGHAGERDIWEQMQVLLERMSQTARARFVMADLSGAVLADSSGDLLGTQINVRRSRPFAVFLIDGKIVLAFIVPLESNSLEAIEASFASSVNRSLWLAIAVAGGVAFLLALLLSRSLANPISALTSAARRMEKGDLSQRVSVEARGELGELAQAFNAMADGLAHLEQLRRNMVTDVAHELRTPLSNIRGYLEAVRDDVLEPEPAVIASLYEEAMLLSRLVDDLQELALAEAGQLTMLPQPIHLADVVDQTLHLFAAQAVEKGVRLETRLPSDLPLVAADPARLSQVLRNLLKNALAYTPPGGSIRLSARASDSTVEVCLQDSGIGISPEHLPFVFERFYRVDKSRTRTTGGAGLGLAIVKQLVEAQGGQVSITSQVGAGTTVTFTTPISPQ